jgi:hypothetical protein
MVIKIPVIDCTSIRILITNTFKKCKYFMAKIRCFTAFLLTLLSGINYSSAQIVDHWQIADVPVKTVWADSVSPGHVYREYPRPQMVRKGSWTNLNGLWQLALSDTSSKSPVNYNKHILVPFPVESALSGVKEKLLPSQFLWYKRTFKNSFSKNEKVLLHFGAVDYKAWVFINGKEVGLHEGGYTSFSFEISKYLLPGENEIVVKVLDPSNDGIGPHGKQVLNPGNIYYTASSGIWQSVWLENVPNSFIESYSVQTHVNGSKVECSVTAPDGLSVGILIKEGSKVVGKAQGKTNNLITISLNNPKLWWPESPFLYNVSITLLKNNTIVDSISGYFGFRTISIAKDEKGIDRIFINNKYIFNHGVLDQGFWPDGLYTAPTASAMEFDIKAIKEMGFNTIRKHIKIEPDLWYYYADRYGVLVWQDMVNPNQVLLPGAKQAFERQSLEIIEQLYNHPSIIMWVAFNERWGQFDQERICNLLRSKDRTRIINGHSGEYLYVDNKLRDSSKTPYIGSDLTDVHSYPYPRLGIKIPGKPQVCGEYGGAGVSVIGHQWDDLKGWGYIKVSSPDLKLKYADMIDSIKRLEAQGLSGSIYTEPFDVEGEENGLITYDRKVIKIKPSELRSINQNLAGSNSGTHGLGVLRNITYDSVTEQQKFEILSGLYEKGGRDSTVLRQLMLLSFRDGNLVKSRQFTKEYIKEVKDVYSYKNLRLLQFVTQGTDDPGFGVFFNNRQKINEVTAENYAETMIRRWIGKSEVKPLLDSGNIDRLESLLPRILQKYGSIGAEKAYGELMIYYLNKENWEKFGMFYNLYFQTAASRSEYHINNISWAVVEHIDNPAILQTALSTMKYNLEKFSGDNPNDMDTYAALLFKTGMKKEALQWQEKAVKTSKNQEVFVNNLDKMRSNKKTW